MEGEGLNGKTLSDLLQKEDEVYFYKDIPWFNLLFIEYFL